MNWKTLLESLLPGLLQFLETALAAAGGPHTEAEKVTAAVNLSQHALALAGVPLPPHDQVTAFVQSAVNKTKPGKKSGPIN